jgi:RNA 2',3'-cyclic 3'-phosphodiesterase
MSMLRAFIAIELPAELQKAISQCIGQLQKTAGKSGVRWVLVENIHLTLKFLGEVSPSSVDLIQQMLSTEANLHSRFQITVGQLGAFPNPRRPRVIWLGVDAPPELAALQRGIESAAAKLGYPPEDRSFSPHLTLGRVREKASSTELTALCASLESMKTRSLGIAQVEGIHLFKSDLLPSGAVYTRLFSATLS